MSNEQFWFCFELAVNCFECFLFLEVPTKILGRRVIGKRWVAIAATMFFILVSVEYLYDFLRSFQSFSFFLCVALYSMLALKGEWLVRLSVSSIPMVVVGLVNVPSLLLVSYINHRDPNVIYEPSPERFWLMMLTKVAFYFVTRLIIRFGSENKNLQTKQWVCISILFLSAQLTLAFLVSTTLIITLFRELIMVFFCITLFILAICMLAFYIISRLSKENEIQTQNQLLLQERSFQQRYLETVRSGNEEVRQIKHDLKNYLLLISQLVRSGKTNEAVAECEKVIGKVESVVTFIETDSAAVNLILNEKLRRCKSNNIYVKCLFHRTFDKADMTDFCIVFANLMDNAIEYSIKIPEDKRSIDIKLTEVSGFFHLEITNYILESVLAKNKALRTTKENKEEHGLGHKSVERIVTGKGGKLRYSEKNHSFCAELVLPK